MVKNAGVPDFGDMDVRPHWVCHFGAVNSVAIIISIVIIVMLLTVML